MAKASRYRAGQRWTFKPAVAEFEDTLVIGHVTDAHPEWGWNERTFDVYVRYSSAAKDAIPADYDGTILSLTDKGLDRSVTKLVERGVALPWWWVYGRRLASQEEAPSVRGVLSCNRVSDALPGAFQLAKQVAEDASERAEAVRKHRLIFGSKKKRKAPSKSVAESWKRITAWIAEHAPALDFPLNHGASEKAIAKVEKAIGAKLPDDFKESVRLHDGGGCWIPYSHGELLSLEGILAQWKKYSEWQAKGEYATGKDWIPREIKGPIKPVFWNKRRVYVTDNSGDHLTLDLDPPAKGRYGQVLHHSHEVGPTEVVASGWATFLWMLADDLESGKYVYLEHENSLELVEELEKPT
ncbi:MAG TPA: SMI1/KNR4 family protein [Gemmataceae bacterium]|jgi:cell wall assembly regulator SMI1|nr:SMI1/KNR4 family protein [Gemmataceae bacterium]